MRIRPWVGLCVGSSSLTLVCCYLHVLWLNLVMKTNPKYNDFVSCTDDISSMRKAKMSMLISVLKVFMVDM